MNYRHTTGESSLETPQFMNSELPPAPSKSLLIRIPMAVFWGGNGFGFIFLIFAEVFFVRGMLH